MEEIRIQLQPKQTEFEKALHDFKVVFYGGARGGGKSFALRNIMLLLCLRNDKTVGAIFRRTYPELDRNIIRPLFQQFPHLQPFYSKTEKLLKLPNGSVLEFNYCAHEDDLAKYQGAEFDYLGIEEAGQWPEEWVQRLRGSNRSSRPGIETRTILTGNPGGIGHKWLKRLFIDRDFNDREVPEDYYFVKALVWDNPALVDNDPGYVDNLKAEPNEAIRKAYLEGDWDIFAGQYFGEWRRDVHVLPEDWEPEDWWKRFGAYDHGFAHPAVFGLFTVDNDGNVYLFHEWAGNRCRVDQIAMGIRETIGKDEWEKLGPIHAGWDCWAKGRTGEPTVHEQFLKLPGDLKMNIIKANIDRINGAQQVRNYLAYQNLPEGMTGPRVFVHPRCTRTIECIPRMIHDDKRPEDVMKVDATESDPWAGDDPYDMFRYGLMSRPGISFKKTKPTVYASRKWFDQRNKQMKKAARAQKAPGAVLKRYS